MMTVGESLVLLQTSTKLNGRKDVTGNCIGLFFSFQTHYINVNDCSCGLPLLFTNEGFNVPLSYSLLRCAARVTEEKVAQSPHARQVRVESFGM